MKFEALRGGRISAARTRKRDWCAWQAAGEVLRGAERCGVRLNAYFFQGAACIAREVVHRLVGTWFFWSSETRARLLPRALRRSSCHSLYVVNIDLKYL